MITNPVTWPNGARVAVAISFDMDSDSTLHLDHPKNAHRLVSPNSWLRYDEVAIPRILEMYRRHEIKQTFFAPSWCIERYPHLIEMILEDGHELAHHGYIHENPNHLSRDDQAYWLQRGIDVFQKATGARPKGFRAPMYNFSESTAALLGKEGFLYDSSLMGDDIPYIIDGGAGTLVELPTHWAMDDWPHYTHMPDFGYTMPISSPNKAMKVFLSEFEAAWEFGGLWVTVWHPFVSGRLARCKRIDEMLSYMSEKGGVWFATLAEIAAHVRSLEDAGEYTPRKVKLPYYDGPIPGVGSREIPPGHPD
ncbi:MAG: polysaccharide deacetylase [Terrimesophilobacter sp.]